MGNLRDFDFSSFRKFQILLFLNHKFCQHSKIKSSDMKNASFKSREGCGGCSVVTNIRHR